MKQKVQNHILQFGVILYWTLFWFFNSVDKIIGGTAEFWVGKDRLTQFTDYFATIGMAESWVPLFTLYVVSVAEIAATALLVIALVQFIRKEKVAADALFFWGTFIGLLIFSLFSIGDQVFGDRVELLEHSIYWIALVVSWGAYEMAGRLK